MDVFAQSEIADAFERTVPIVYGDIVACAMACRQHLWWVYV